VSVPWTKLLSSKGVELTLEEVHIVLTSSEAYDRAFVKKSLLEMKKETVTKLMKQVKEQLQQSL